MPVLKYFDANQQAWVPVAGYAGYGLLPGGLPGTQLRKNTTTDFDMSWCQTSGTVVQDKAASLLGSFGSGTFTSYQPIGWGTMPFTKQFAATNMRVEIGMSCWMSGAGGLFTYGMSPTNSAADVVQINQYFFNALGDHKAFTGFNDITGRAAGNYSFTICFKLSSASMVFQTDGNDYVWQRVSEVWP